MVLMPVCGSSPRDKFANSSEQKSAPLHCCECELANSTERISSRLHAGDAGDAGDALRRSRRRVSVRRIC